MFLVEILYLVQVQQHASRGEEGVQLVDYLFDVGDAGGGGVELAQRAVGALGDYPGHGGLAGAGGAVEYHVGYLAAVHYAPEHAVFSQDMWLAHHVLQTVGPYFVCKRLVHLRSLSSKSRALPGQSGLRDKCRL